MRHFVRSHPIRNAALLPFRGPGWRCDGRSLQARTSQCSVIGSPVTFQRTMHKEMCTWNEVRICVKMHLSHLNASSEFIFRCWCLFNLHWCNWFVSRSCRKSPPTHYPDCSLHHPHPSRSVWSAATHVSKETYEITFDIFVSCQEQEPDLQKNLRICLKLRISGTLNQVSINLGLSYDS